MDDLTRETMPRPKPDGPRPSTPQEQARRRAELARNWLPPRHLRQAEEARRRDQDPAA